MTLSPTRYLSTLSASSYIFHLVSESINGELEQTRHILSSTQTIPGQFPSLIATSSIAISLVNDVPIIPSNVN